jgi:hypothetical protein
MKSIIVAALLMWILPASAQFKPNGDPEPTVAESLVHPSAGLGSLFGFLNSDNFRMNHSVSMSYLSTNAGGLSLASYTNTMLLKLADPLHLRVDLTLQGSPFGNSLGLQQSELSGFFLSNAELNYHPSENMFIDVRYGQLPAYGYGYSPLGVGYYGYR